jgi:hypothetical protein
MDGTCCCCCWSCSSISLISQHTTLLLYHSRLCFEASRKNSLRFRWLNTYAFRRSSFLQTPETGSFEIHPKHKVPHACVHATIDDF